MISQDLTWVYGSVVHKLFQVRFDFQGKLFRFLASISRFLLTDRSCSVVGRSAGAFFRHADTKSLNSNDLKNDTECNKREVFLS